MAKYEYSEEEVVSIEKPSESPKEFHSNAKSHRGIILSLLIRLEKDIKKGIVNYSLMELRGMLKEALDKYDELKKNTDIVTLEILGWKGKDILEIYKGFDNEFILLEHRKSKETKEIETTKHNVSSENVNRLLNFIKTWKIGEVHNCYYFTETLGEKDWAEIRKKRTNLYFPCYYYPLKCLEIMGIVRYSSGEKITRLK